MRCCRTCGELKPLMDFYNQSNGSIFKDCKPCWQAYVKNNRLLRLDQYTTYERNRAMLPHRVELRAQYAKTDGGKEAIRRGSKAWVLRNPIKREATTMVGNAVRDGRLLRQSCEVCATTKAQAHHDDYSKPLDVRWLCTKHHAEWHRKNTPLCPDQEQAA